MTTLLPDLLAPLPRPLVTGLIETRKLEMNSLYLKAVGDRAIYHRDSKRHVAATATIEHLKAEAVFIEALEAALAS